MQFAASGASEGGIVPLSLSMVPTFKKLGTFALIPADKHAAEPLRQRMVLLKRAGRVATEFYQYLQRPEVRTIFTRYGFKLPSETMP